MSQTTFNTTQIVILLSLAAIACGVITMFGTVVYIMQTIPTTPTVITVVEPTLDISATTAPSVEEGAEPSPTPTSMELYRIYNGPNKVGFMNNQGQVIIPPDYRHVGEFSEGLAWLEVNGKVGYIDQTGRMVIEPQFDFPVDNFFGINFSEGLAVVHIGDRQGYINREGKLVINPLFDWAFPFNNGAALVMMPNRTWGFVDHQGEFLFPPMGVGLGSNDLEPIMYLDSYTILDGNFFLGYTEGLAPVEKEGKRGAINHQGELVVPLEFESITLFQEGLIAVVEDDMKLHKQWGYINYKGELVIPYQYEDTSFFSEGLAAVEVDKNWGYIDPQGTMMIPPQFEVAFPFKEGLAGVRVGYHWGFIDPSGHFFINPIYSQVESFRGGLAFVVHSDQNKAGYINQQGDWVWSYTFVLKPPKTSPSDTTSYGKIDDFYPTPK